MSITSANGKHGDTATARPTTTRRAFVAGACAGVAGLAATQLIGEEAQKAQAAEGGDAETATNARRLPQSAYDAVIRGSYQIDMGNVTPFETVGEPDAYDYEADVLLIGYGVGGTSAALTAVNRGLSVVAMERSTRDTWYEHAGVGFVCAFGLPFWLEKLGLPDWGPDSIRAFLDNVLIEKHLSEADFEAAINFYTKLPVAFQQIVDTDGDATSFEYVEVLPSWKMSPTMVPTNKNLADDIHTIWLNKYFGVENALDRYVEKQGATILWGTPATNLVVDEDGAVVGAKGQDQDGREVFVRAQRVIDCIGGMAANYDMIKFYGGQVDQMLGCNVGSLVNDGAGVRLCQGAGAGMRGTPRCDDVADGAIDAIGLGLSWNFINEYPATPDRFMTAYAYSPIMLGRQPFLRVNKHGRRFMNEDNGWTLKMKCAYKQPNHRFYTVFDSTFEQAFEDIYHTGGRWGACEYPITTDRMVYFGDDDIRPCADWHEGFEDGLEKGFIVKADTLEELAEKLDINVENFLQTVEDYNALCEAGEDTQYGKDPALLYKVSEPPFYGMERMPGIAWGINGGVAIDKDGHVLNDRGEIIPGLLCGAGDGNMADGNTAEHMEQSVVPGGCQYALTMGYIAVSTAADEILGAGVVREKMPAVVTSKVERQPQELSEAAQVMNDNCALCHSVPTAPNFAARDEGSVAELLADHDGVSFGADVAEPISEWVAGA